jgi:hypothetical protein
MEYETARISSASYFQLKNHKINFKRLNVLIFQRYDN